VDDLLIKKAFGQKAFSLLRKRAGVTAMMLFLDLLFFCLGGGFLFVVAKACVGYSSHANN